MIAKVGSVNVIALVENLQEKSSVRKNEGIILRNSMSNTHIKLIGQVHVDQVPWKDVGHVDPLLPVAREVDEL